MRHRSVSVSTYCTLGFSAAIFSTSTFSASTFSLACWEPHPAKIAMTAARVSNRVVLIIVTPFPIDVLNEFADPRLATRRKADPMHQVIAGLGLRANSLFQGKRSRMPE